MVPGCGTGRRSVKLNTVSGGGSLPTCWRPVRCVNAATGRLQRMSMRLSAGLNGGMGSSSLGIFGLCAGRVTGGLRRIRRPRWNRVGRIGHGIGISTNGMGNRETCYC
jgi:hypothetical protein